MAIETTTISGNVYDANGVLATGGTIRCQLSHPGIARDLSNSKDEVIAGVITTSIASNGAVSFALVPNDAITPVGTVYLVKFQLPNGYSWTEYWSVATAPDPVEIGDVLRVDAPSLAELVADVPSVVSLPAASSQWLRRVLIESPGGANPQSTWICLLDDDGVTPVWVPLT